jgi:prepilin-type N-terminal cleavage/methylation domain-containing protein
LKRKGFTLIELMVVIAIIIILAAIAIPNYLNMTKRAKNSRLESDFATLATALETFKTDWGKYPYTNSFESINDKAGDVYGELSGVAHSQGTAMNVANATNAIGEKNGASAPFIEYIKAGTLDSMVNPFDATGANPIKYGSVDGTNWTLYVNTTGTNNGTTPYLVRTSDSSTPSFNTSAPTIY